MLDEQQHEGSRCAGMHLKLAMAAVEHQMHSSYWRLRLLELGGLQVPPLPSPLGVIWPGTRTAPPSLMRTLSLTAAGAAPTACDWETEGTSDRAPYGGPLDPPLAEGPALCLGPLGTWPPPA